MTAKKVTYNKDGTPRKNGSGRKKGSNSFVRVTYSQLKEYIGEKTPITVSRVWLESLGFLSEEDSAVILKNIQDEPASEENKILFKVHKD
jgi:hypothetical protein